MQTLEKSEENFKKCPKCGEIKSYSNFSKDSSRSVGIYHTCRNCCKKYAKKHNAKPEIKLKNKHYRDVYDSRPDIKTAKKIYNAKPERRQAKRDYYHKPTIKERYRERLLLRKYEMTLEEYNTLLFKQEYCCAICAKHESKIKKRLHVDHCHTTGRIRGLLCSLCNTAIGALQDSENILSKAIEYLKRGK